MSTPQETNHANADDQPLTWGLYIFITIIAAALMTSGIWLFMRQTPQTANFDTAPQTSAPWPHDHCDPMPAQSTVPDKRISIPEPDILDLSLILQEFAHQQGGCYYHLDDEYRIALPAPAMDRMQQLRHNNYVQWTGHLPTAIPISDRPELRQVNLGITEAGNYSPWRSLIGIILFIIGIMAGIVAVAGYVETARSRRKD